MGGIGVIVNPYARFNSGNGTDRVARLAEAARGVGTVRLTTSLGEIERVAGEFRARGIDILAVCGGDGSVFRTLTGYIRACGSERLPLLLPLRAGTINNLSRSVGCPRGRPERVLARVADDYRRGHTPEVTERDLLCVNGDQYGFIFGAAAIVGFLEAYYAGRRPGSAWATLLVARLGVSALLGTRLIRRVFRSVDGELLCDGQRVPFERFSVLLAATITDLPLGFRPLSLATREAGAFHLLAGPIGARRILSRLACFRRGVPAREPQLYNALAREVRAVFDRPTFYMIDADILGPATELRITAGPRLSLIRG